MTSRLPLHILRLEGALALIASVWFYTLFGGGWLLFALLFLLPDISMVGYLSSPRTGAFTYNLFHTYSVPLLLVLIAWPAQGYMFSLALIWIAHIGFDRLLGYGLKHTTRFQDTHLGPLGRRSGQQNT